LTSAVLFVFLATGCGSSHRLQEYEFAEHTVAVVAAIPPRATVTTSSGDAWFNMHRPISSLFRVGTAMVKHEEAVEAQARLDTALQQVDVVEAMSREFLTATAPSLGMQIVRKVGDADFLFDVRIVDYGIHADSWEGATFFVMAGEILLVDNTDKSLIWKRRVDERDRIAPGVFGLGTTAGNIVTAHTLSQLSQEAIASGLEALALDTARRVSRKLRDDLYRSR
jgi:hypothetical protein